jgi:hypothetical protein
MIVHCHDHGWGPQWPIKQIEREITDHYLAPLIQSNQRVVLINSTWYGQQQHTKILSWLGSNPWDLAVVISMIDAPIADASWFAEFDRPVIDIGSYPGPHFISLWAEVAARHIRPCREHDIDLPFMCLNRKPHWHRRRLYEQMSVAGILDQGLVSMGGVEGSPAVRTLSETVPDNDLAPNGTQDHYGICNDIASLGDLTNWRRHFLNIVTETVFEVDAKYFVSEKIFKPILGSRPFLVYAPGGAEQWLKYQGFEPYLDDFRDISDLDLRDANNIVPFLATLNYQEPRYWQQKYLDLLPKIQYNLQRFKNFVAEQRQRVRQGISCPI